MTESPKTDLPTPTRGVEPDPHVRPEPVTGAEPHKNPKKPDRGVKPDPR